MQDVRAPPRRQKDRQPYGPLRTTQGERRGHLTRRRTSNGPKRNPMVGQAQVRLRSMGHDTRGWYAVIVTKNNVRYLIKFSRSKRRLQDELLSEITCVPVSSPRYMKPGKIALFWFKYNRANYTFAISHHALYLNIYLLILPPSIFVNLAFSPHIPRPNSTPICVEQRKRKHVLASHKTEVTAGENPTPSLIIYLYSLIHLFRCIHSVQHCLKRAGWRVVGRY